MLKKSEKPVTLFVVHWNQPVECAATVNAMIAQNIPLQVIVIDNDSRPDAYRLLQSEIASIATLVRLSENKGWGGALNVVLREWLQEQDNAWCLISAHDSLPQSDCLRLLLETAEADPRVGIACPQYPDCSIAKFSALRGVHPEIAAAQSVGVAQSVDVPHGTLMLVRRACLQQIGLFDERYFAYGDEHELGARAVRHGWKVVMVWGAIVTNPGTSTSSPLRSYLFARNSLLLVRDYFGPAAAWLRVMLLLANTVRIWAFSRNDAFAFSTRARWQALRDHLAGRYGKPVLR